LPPQSHRGSPWAFRGAAEPLERPGVGTEVVLALQAHPAGDVAQVHQPSFGPEAWSNWRIASEPSPAAACAPMSKWHDLHGDRRAARGGPRQSAQLLAHHRCTSHLLLERRLADDQVNLRLVLFEDRPLPGEDRLHRAVARGIIFSAGSASASARA
jgi:hypothetical protein